MARRRSALSGAPSMNTRLRSASMRAGGQLGHHRQRAGKRADLVAVDHQPEHHPAVMATADMPTAPRTGSGSKEGLKLREVSFQHYFGESQRLDAVRVSRTMQGSAS
jgi:hypothetical protein